MTIEYYNIKDGTAQRENQIIYNLILKKLPSW